MSKFKTPPKEVFFVTMDPDRGERKTYSGTDTRMFTQLRHAKQYIKCWPGREFRIYSTNTRWMELDPEKI